VFGFTVNSLRFNGGSQTVTLSLTNTLQSGGILVTPTGGGTITGGTLAAQGNGELIVHQYSATPFVINSALVSTAATGLTKTGPGTLVLGGNNAISGAINVSRGGLSVTTVNAVNTANQIVFNDVRAGAGLQTLTVDLGAGVAGTINPPIKLSAYSATDGGTYFSTGASANSRVTLGGPISSGTGLTTPVTVSANGANTSGFNLTAANTFTGTVYLSHGTLGINSNASLGDPANALVLNVGSTLAGGLEFLTTGVTLPRSVTIATPTRLVSNGTDGNTVSGIVSGGGGLFKAGTGTLTLSNAANTVTGGVTVSAGTLSFGTTGGLPAGQAVTVGPGAVFSPPTAAGGSYGTVTLTGGTFRVPAGSGRQYQVNQIVTTSAGGGVDFTGAGADQLVLTSPGAAVTVGGNAQWLSPLNTAALVNGTQADIPFTIAAGVTLTNGLSLGVGNGVGFRIVGGGTLSEMPDTTNVVAMTAPVTAVQSRYRVADASTNGGVGALGSGTFTLAPRAPRSRPSA
jgi:fibronectin-binding autotransporter adhesin